MQPLSGRSIAVVGSGFGGLSTACYLADAGADVTVLEQNEQVGGRASTLEMDGFTFDMGPSWYLMPDVFERFFGDFDREPGDYYELEHLDPHYRIFFKDNAGRRPDGSPPGLDVSEDGDTVDVTPDREQVKEIFDAYEPGAGAVLDDYLAQSRENYEVGMEHFVYEDRPRIRDWLDPKLAKYARGLTLLGSMQDHVENYFEHPKLQQIMQYTLVFLGGAPNSTPALYNLMSHVDFNLGVYYPRGREGLGTGNPDEPAPSGLNAVAVAMADLARELGVEFRTNHPVASIRGERGNFRVYTDGETDVFDADVVVSDADYAHTEQALLEPADRQYDADYWESRTYAPSAFLLYLGVEGDVDDLAHHTLVLPSNWEHHFDEIFEDPAWPDDPAYYLCVPSETDDSVAPDGHSNLFALVPIAAGLDDTPEVRDSYRDLVLDDIAENTGVDLRDRIVAEETFTVSEFQDRYNSFRGTARGHAHTLRQTSLFRPSHRSSALDGLYFTGSYTTPGIGVPMCTISGDITADYVLEDET
jgi:phytoene desaturase